MNPTHTCFFIGHREAPQSLLPALRASIEEKITSYGVLNFVVGHYGAFDSMATLAVSDVKKYHSDVTLTLLSPYPVSKIPTEFDGSFSPPGIETVSRRFAIVYANRYMISHCQFLIAYVTHPGSNASRFLRLAAERARGGHLKIENLGGIST